MRNLSGKICGNAKLFCYTAEPLILRPQKGGRMEEDGSNQMCIDQTNSPIAEKTHFNHLPYFTDLRGT
jgi:hypothetical protein